MNRIQQSAKRPEAVSPNPQFELASATFSPSSCDCPHALFAPLHYESKYAYPLIVWLHGAGNDERQLTRIMPPISMRNYVAVAPRGVLAERPRRPGTEGYCWMQSPEHIQQAEQRIFDSIAAADRKYHFSRRRVFLAGFDCGGTMAFRVAMSHPSRFAGVLSLCGPFPTRGNPFGQLAEARTLPVFLATGRYSREYPQEAVCENLRLFHAAGIPITLRQYPCCHELIPQMLRDVNRWIIEQVISPCDCL